MRDVHLKDLKEFLDWAMKQDAKTRFKLSDRYSHGQTMSYQLDVAGSGDRFRPMQSIHIPEEVGKPLSAVWKSNAYGRYVGLRNIKSILKIVKVSDAIVAKYEATRLAVKAQQERQRVHNRTDYALDRIKHITRELNSLNETLSELPLDEDALGDKPNLFIPDLPIVDDMLRTLKEDTK